MRNKKVLLLLSMTLFILTVVPFLGATFFMNSSIETTLNLGFNSEVKKALGNSAQNLKLLKSLDPIHENHYKSQFDQNIKLLQIYSESELVKQQIKKSIKIYFWFGLIIAVGFALVISLFLSKKIHRSYQSALSELIKEKEKVTYLEEISSWQELAKMLAHEIKNPLTPIEILISSLSTAHENKSKEDFRRLIDKTESMVNEELYHLKSIVNKFSEFSKLPQVELSPTPLHEAIDVTLQSLKTQNPDLNVFVEDQTARAVVPLDKTLFRQVLVNLIKNGLEANPNTSPQFQLKLVKKPTSKNIQISLSNSGVPIPSHMAPKIFDPYISSKKDKSNMGLGLTISKKIILEHGGNINYEEIDRLPTFIITLPEAHA